MLNSSSKSGFYLENAINESRVFRISELRGLHEVQFQSIVESVDDKKFDCRAFTVCMESQNLHC